MLQKAGLSEEADPENYLGGSSETMYYIGLDVHKRTISYWRVDPMSRRYPGEGAPGPSLLGTGVLGGPGFHPGAQSSQRRDRASGSC